MSKISPLSECRLQAIKSFSKGLDEMEKDFSTRRQSRLVLKKSEIQGIPTYVKLNSR